MLELNNVASKITRIPAFQKILFSIISISLLSLSANGQNFDLQQYSFEINGEILPNPMTGGYTSPQLNFIDIDMDGQEELMVFDRKGNVARIYEHDGVAGSTNYSHAPALEADLPPMKDYVLVEDYNADGIPDIFTSAEEIGGSMAMYKGTLSGSKIEFNRYQSGNFQFDVLTVVAGGSPTQIYVSSVDVPEVVDVDNDGDLDVLSFEPGGTYVSY